MVMALNYRSMKLLISVMLILTILVMAIILPYQIARAEAALLLAASVICPEVLIPVVCVIVIATGLVLTAQYTSEQIANWWWSQAGVAMRQQVIDSYNAAANGVFKVTTDLYNNVRNWCIGKFSVGDNAVTINSQTYNLDGQQWMVGRYVADSTPAYTIPFVYGNDITIFNSRYQLVFKAQYGTLENGYDRYDLYIDGVDKSSSFKLSVYPGTVPNFFLYMDGSKLRLGYTSVSAPYSEPVQPRGTIMRGKVTSVASTWNENVFGNPTWVSQNVVGNPVLTDTTFPDTIPKDADNRISLGYTGTLSDLYNLTYGQVIGQTLNPAQPTTVPVSLDTSVDPTQELDWNPLKVAGDAFTRAFPFSLPWDLMRSFTTLAADPVEPNFTISVPDTKLLKGMKFTVDLSRFSTLLAFAKTMELLAFDMGLVMITRKMLGGAV